MIYEVDTERIEKQLNYLDKCIRVIEKASFRLEEKSGDDVVLFAAARSIHIAVECFIDAGSVMIDGFMMREPGGYLDIVDILEDEQVIPSESVEPLKDLVRLRDRLVRRYDEVTREELAEGMKKAGVLGACIRWVRDYLTRELGPGDPGGSEGTG